MALRIIGIDHGSKESLVKECGAEHFLDITKFDDKTLPEEVKKLTGGLGASAVIVCTASNRAYAQALDLLRFGGTLVCVGMPEGDSQPIAKVRHIPTDFMEQAEDERRTFVLMPFLRYGFASVRY